MHELEVRLELVEKGRRDGVRGPEEGVVVGELRKDDAEEEADCFWGDKLVKFGRHTRFRLKGSNKSEYSRPTIRKVAKELEPR